MGEEDAETPARDAKSSRSEWIKNRGQATCVVEGSKNAVFVRLRLQVSQEKVLVTDPAFEFLSFGI